MDVNIELIESLKKERAKLSAPHCGLKEPYRGDELAAIDKTIAYLETIIEKKE